MTVKTLLSHLVTRKFNSPVNSPVYNSFVSLPAKVDAEVDAVARAKLAAMPVEVNAEEVTVLNTLA
eukprot:933469-Prorocentrum_minimum.AAC.1